MNGLARLNLSKYARPETFEPFPFDQFEIGVEVEKEHKSTVHGNIFDSARIAIDHLEEDSNYYSKLKKMEGEK